MTRIWILLGAIAVVFSACVPNKKLVYFQQADLKKRSEIPKDTVLRTRPMEIQEYRIQPLDFLSINFETISEEDDAFDFFSKISPQRRTSAGNPAATASLTGIMVDTQGNIEYPVLGKIAVGGLTILQAKDTIQGIASKFFPDVVVRTVMLNFRFTILGEVNGEQVVTSTNPRLTIAEAIGMAGGIGEFGDRSHVKIIRQRGNNSEVFYVNLLEEKFIESPNFYVQQNDVIIVPPLKQRPFRRYFTTNLAIITSTVTFALLIISLYNR